MLNKKKALIIMATLMTACLIGASSLAVKSSTLRPAVQTPAPGAPSPSPSIIATPVPTPSPTPEPTPEPTPTPKPISPEVLALVDADKAVREEKRQRGDMLGRLVVPSADIDVALIPDSGGGNLAAERQYICDLEDSALIYEEYNSLIIADHNNQGFITLPNIRRGDMAYILCGGRIVSLRCETVFDGINTGLGVTDTDGTPAPFYASVICYTCGVDWVNVKVCGFEVTDDNKF